MRCKIFKLYNLTISKYKNKSLKTLDTDTFFEVVLNSLKKNY